MVFLLHAYPRPKQRNRVENNSPRALRIPRLSREYLKLHEVGTSLGVQWLRLHLPMQGVLVQFLVRELRANMRCSQKTKA